MKLLSRYQYALLLNIVLVLAALHMTAVLVFGVLYRNSTLSNCFL